MKLTFSLIGLIILLTSSCKTQQNFTPDNFEGRMLTFGTEGGFAGTTSEHYIFENGQLFSFESRQGQTLEGAKIDQNVVSQVFASYTTLGFDKLELNNPGNLSYYIKMKTGDQERTIKWGGPNEETPEVLKQYFKNLAQIVKKYKTVTQ